MEVLQSVRAFLSSRGVEAYLVGGTIRDMLLGRETHDIDIAVEGRASDLARDFADEQGAALYVMDEEHDVARVILSDSYVDFSRLRGESIRDDLATRDFTINAMAAPLADWAGSSSQVIDPFGGLTDLSSRKIKCVLPGVFTADPVRLLRGIRFEAELSFELDFQTADLVRTHAALVRFATPERVRDELVLILGAPRVLHSLNRLDALSVLTELIPELEPLRGLEQSPPHVYDALEHTFRAVAAMERIESEGFAFGGKFSEELLSHFQRKMSGARTRGMMLRLALLLHDIGKPPTRTRDTEGRLHFYDHARVGAEMAEAILERLRFSRAEISWMRQVIGNHLRPILLMASSTTDRAVHRYFRDLGEAGVDVAVHAWCDQAATYGAALPEDINSALTSVIMRLLESYYAAHDSVVMPKPLLTGADIMSELGLSPGPKIGEILKALVEAQAAGEVATRAQAIKWLRDFDTAN